MCRYRLQSCLGLYYFSLKVYGAAAAAQSLQSCPTLCDPIDRLPRPWDSPGKNTGVGCHFLLQCMKVKSESELAQCLTLSDPMDCSLPGSSIHGICQARVLEWGAIAFSTKVYVLFQIWRIFCHGLVNYLLSHTVTTFFWWNFYSAPTPDLLIPGFNFFLHDFNLILSLCPILSGFLRSVF